MPTKLSTDSISRAISHLCKYGDTDVFPHLIELVFLSEKKAEIIDELTTLDLETFSPLQAIETIAPKSRYGFRIVHQLPLLETLLFTASTVEIASDLEKLKRPLREDLGPFSYRYLDGTDASIYMTGRTYHDWLEWQAAKVHGGAFDYVISTDIADFYQRIYMHRIENCLDIATANKGIKRFIERLIKQVRSKQSHGIPVGGTASRLIAEAVLTDTDNALADEQFVFTRFVDDYRIFINAHQSAYSILAFFADQLAASEGLALNAQKTRVQTAAHFHASILNQLGDPSEEAEFEAFDALQSIDYFDEGISPKDISKLAALNLLGMLEGELTADIWDFARIKGVFRALRLVPDPDSIEFVTNNFQLFLPFMKDLVLYLDALNRSYSVDTTGLRDVALTEINTGAASSVPTIRVWILELFVRGIISVDSRDLTNLSAPETLENRQLYLIRGIKNDVNFFR